MKKFINVLAVLLALVMCLGIVVACASEDEQAGGDETTPAATTTTGKTVTTTTPPVTTTVEVTTNYRDGKNPTPTVDVPADGVITTAEQLHAVLVNGAVDGTYTVNATKLDMTPYTWKGMVGFTGTFDFNGCVIEGAVDSLFISVLGGTVKNLTIANATYQYTNDESLADTDPKTNEAPNVHYSPVIRYATDVTVENVVIDSTVTVKSDIWTETSNHGGVIGGAYGSNIVIKNCHFKGNYETDSTLVRVGGIAGIVNPSDAAAVDTAAPENSTAIVLGCTNTGYVKNAGYGKDSKAGGVVGYLANAATVKCANYGEMFSNDGGQTGGVVGYVGNTTAMKDCLNVGKVTGTTFVGGICAYSNGSARYFYNCINLGAIDAGTGANNGGIVGLAKSSETVTNCFNLKSVNEKFIQNVNNAPADPADATTHVSMVITGCGNLDTVDAIFTAIEAVAPGVFVKTADGTSLEVVLPQ